MTRRAMANEQQSRLLASQAPIVIDGTWSVSADQQSAKRPILNDEFVLPSGNMRSPRVNSHASLPTREKSIVIRPF